MTIMLIGNKSDLTVSAPALAILYASCFKLVFSSKCIASSGAVLETGGFVWASSHVPMCASVSIQGTGSVVLQPLSSTV